MTPACEVVIPTRNAPSVLWLALTHLWAFNDWGGISQVTLVDNRSTAEGMEDVFRQARREGCRVVRNERNVGVWASVNRGLLLARSPRVFVLTADVLLAPHTIQAANRILDEVGGNLVHLGPAVIEGPGAMAGIPRLGVVPAQASLDFSSYNGAAFLLQLDALRAAGIGLFDPDYYVCAGDTDHIERLRKAGLAHAVIANLPCVHLDKQSRRADANAVGDTEMEIRDLDTFHQKWAGCPDVLERHPIPNRELWLSFKTEWDKMRVA